MLKLNNTAATNRDYKPIRRLCLMAGLALLGGIHTAAAATILEYPTQGTPLGFAGFTIPGGSPYLIYIESGSPNISEINFTGGFETPPGTACYNKIKPDGTVDQSAVLPTDISPDDFPTSIISKDLQFEYLATANGIGFAKEGSCNTEYLLPTPSSNPADLTLDANGNLWFVESAFNKIGKITTSYSTSSGAYIRAGIITEYLTSTDPIAHPAKLVLGADGNLWFIETTTNNIGKITPDGIITKYPLPAGSVASNTILGPDGNIWFTESETDKLGKITPDGTVTEYPLSNGGRYPNNLGGDSLVVGPDGNLWFVEYAANKIGKITVSGTVTEYPLPTANSQPESILSAFADSTALYFTDPNTNKIGKITLDGIITEFSIPTPNSHPKYLKAFQGGIWFAESNSQKIGALYLDNYLESSSAQSTLGQAVTFTANVSTDNGTAGKVTLYVDNIPVSGGEGIPFLNGKAIFTTSSLTVGTHTIYGTYCADLLGKQCVTLVQLIQVVNPVVTPTPTTIPTPTPTVVPTPVVTPTPTVIPTVVPTPTPIPTNNHNDADYDDNTHTCTIRDVKVNNQHHYQVKLRLQADNRFSLLSADLLDIQQASQPSAYDDGTQALVIPLVQVNGHYFKAVLHNTGNFNFRLDQLAEIQ